MTNALGEIDNLLLRIRLIDDIRSVLTSNACRRIDFRFTTIHVNGAGFAAVARSLLDAAQGQPGVAATFEAMPPGAAGLYDSVKNKLAVPVGFRPQNVFDKQILVHESVHAMQDILDGSRPMHMRVAPRSTLRVDNECAAWIAGAVYLYYEGVIFEPSAKPAYRAAYDITTKIKDWPGTNVAPADVAKMRAVLRATPVYRHLRGSARTLANGL